jgi:hypothetical protein
MYYIIKFFGNSRGEGSRPSLSHQINAYIEIALNCIQLIVYNPLFQRIQASCSGFESAYWRIFFEATEIIGKILNRRNTDKNYTKRYSDIAYVWYLFLLRKH